MRLAECGSVCAKEVKSRGFWRDVIVEMMATFLLVSVQCALPLSWKSTDTGSVGIQVIFIKCQQKRYIDPMVV